MQKFFKKSLALALAAVLGLSAFTASAADSATIALGNAEITAPVADTTVKVPVTITGSNIAAVIFDVAVAEPLTLSDVDFKGEDANSDGVFENQNCTATICGNKVLVEAGTDEVVPAAAETLSLDLIVTVPASTPANSYSISISEVQACNNGSISVDDQGNTSFSDDVQLIAINTSATGGVVVKEPAPSHEHDFSGEWKYDETNHWKECVADGCTNPVAKDKEAAHNYVEGTCVCGATQTVEPPPATETLTTSLNRVSGNTQFNLTVYFNLEFTGSIKTKGALFYTPEAYTDGMEVSVDTANDITTLTSNNSCALSGFSLGDITKKFVFVPYVIDSNDVYYYGAPEKISYADDYLFPRLTTGTEDSGTTLGSKSKSKIILDTYKSTFNKDAYAGQPAVNQPAPAAGTYTDVAPVAYDTTVGEFVVNGTLSGSVTDYALMSRFDCSAAYNLSKIQEYGVLFYLPETYTANKNADTISIDTANGSTSLENYTIPATLSGFSFGDISKQFVFIPYVVDSEGAYHYGSATKMSYANYLIGRINNGSGTTPNRALALLDMYKAIYNTSLYTYAAN